METKATLDEIEKLKVNGIYIHSREDPYYCPQVNGLTNICLNELGFKELARANLNRFLDSPAYDKKIGLFYRETETNGNVRVPAFNSCKNSVMALSLWINGFNEEASRIMNSLRQSPAYDSQKGLFVREYDSQTGEVNPTIITQSNLWTVLALVHVGRPQEAKEIMRRLEIEKLRGGLFIDKDCRFKDSPDLYFADDQALAALSYLSLEENDKAKEIVRRVLKSGLYDSEKGLFNRTLSEVKTDTIKSTYKNSLIALALEKLGFRRELCRLQEGLVTHLYDSTTKLFNQTTVDRTKVPDNSALAVFALQLGREK